MSILQILDELAATPSINEKVAILNREKNNGLLKRVFQAAYNPMVNYYVKKIPAYKAVGVMPLTHAIEDLGRLSSREFTGNKAIEFLSELLKSVEQDDAIVIERIIDRDLRCGTSDTLASRVWPGLVPTFDVMLCDKDMSRIEYPAFAQTKCDGARVHLFFDGTNVKAMSRAGKEFQLLGALDGEAKRLMKAGECWDGELLVMKDGKVLDRKTSNGIVNKANKGTISQEEADMIVAVVWDIVDFTSTIPYSLRFDLLEDRPLSNKIKVVKSIIVNSEEEAMDFFKEQLDAGEEGAIIKNTESLWVPKRSKDLCKLKEINTADMIVVDIFEGTGKYQGMLGGIVCETADGEVNVRVGSGFSDADRAMNKAEDWIGNIVEVLYNAKIKSKGRVTYSLFLPRLSVVRFDKTEANTLKELK